MPGAVAVLLAAVLFGTTGTAQALGPDTATPLGVGGLRIAIGAVVLVALAWPAPRSTSRPHTGWWLAGGVGVAAYQPAFFTGTDRSGVALGTIVALGSGPAFAGLLDGVLFRRRPSRTWLRATAVAVTGGIVLVAAQGGGAQLDAVGLGCSLAAGASYAVFAIATKAVIERGVDSTVAMAGVFAIGAALLLPIVATEPFGWLATGTGALMIAHLGVLTVAVAYWLYGYGLRTLPTTAAVTLTLAEPVTAALAGVVVLDERLPGLGWFGAGLVILGLALSGGAWPARRSRRRASPARRR